MIKIFQNHSAVESSSTFIFYLAENAPKDFRSPEISTPYAIQAFKGPWEPRHARFLEWDVIELHVDPDEEIAIVSESHERRSVFFEDHDLRRQIIYYYIAKINAGLSESKWEIVLIERTCMIANNYRCSARSASTRTPFAGSTSRLDEALFIYFLFTSNFHDLHQSCIL